MPMRNDLGAMMDDKIQINILRGDIAEFCQKHHIRKLSLFGSALRGDFRPESDVDVLVEFEPRHVPGFIRLASMKLELSNLFGGRKVDINTAQCLSRYFRDEVVRTAEVQYAKG